MTTQISPIELAQRLQSSEPVHLLDVREAEEHQFVALRNSTLIPLGQLAQHIEEIEKWRDEEIVVYCHHGIRSLSAIRQLKDLGFTNLRNLAGGIDRWTTEVEPTLPRY